MMIMCNECLLQIYNNLNNIDLSFLYYLDGKEKQIKSSIGNNDNSELILQSLVIENNIKSFCNKFNKKISKIRIVVECLYKMGLISRTKKDHSWNYSLTNNGKTIVDMLKRDSKKENQVVNILKGRKNKNA